MNNSRSGPTGIALVSAIATSLAWAPTAAVAAPHRTSAAEGGRGPAARDRR